MVSKRQRIVAVIAIIVVVIIVSAGGVYVLVNQPPNPSMAEKMTLNQGDINSFGFRSSRESQSSIHYANESSSFLAALSNETITLYIWIDVFNSSNASRAAFLDVIQYLVGDRKNITLGDGAIYWPQSNRTPSLIFIRSNVMAWVQTLSPEVDYAWLRNSTIALATLQLQKIDSNNAV